MSNLKLSKIKASREALILRKTYFERYLVMNEVIASKVFALKQQHESFIS
jgi:hypothetical protein